MAFTLKRPFRERLGLGCLVYVDPIITSKLAIPFDLSFLVALGGHSFWILVARIISDLSHSISRDRFTSSLDVTLLGHLYDPTPLALVMKNQFE